MRLAAVIALLACVPRPAQAQDGARPLDEALSVAEGGDECLTHEALVDHVASWLGSRSLDARMAVVVTPLQGEGVAFVIRRDDDVIAARRFALMPPSCPDRRAALSLAIALAIDHTVLDGLGIAASPVGPEEGGAPGATEPVEGQAAGNAASSGDTTLAAGVGSPAHGPEGSAGAGAPPAVGMSAALAVGLLVSVLPDLAYGAGATLEVDLRDRLVIRGGALISSTADAGLGVGQAQGQLVIGRLDACMRRGVSRFLLDACAGGAAGVVFAEGRGYDRSLSTHLPWAGLVGRLAVRFVASEVVHVGLSAEGLLALARPRLRVRAFDGSLLASRALPRGGGNLSLEFILVFR